MEPCPRPNHVSNARFSRLDVIVFTFERHYVKEGGFVLLLTCGAGGASSWWADNQSTSGIRVPVRQVEHSKPRNRTGTFTIDLTSPSAAFDADCILVNEFVQVGMTVTSLAVVIPSAVHLLSALRTFVEVLFSLLNCDGFCVVPQMKLYRDVFGFLCLNDIALFVTEKAEACTSSAGAGTRASEGVEAHMRNLYGFNERRDVDHMRSHIL